MSRKKSSHNFRTDGVAFDVPSLSGWSDELKTIEPLDMKNRFDILFKQYFLSICFTLYLTVFYFKFQEKTSRRESMDGFVIYS